MEEHRLVVEDHFGHPCIVAAVRVLGGHRATDYPFLRHLMEAYQAHLSDMVLRGFNVPERNATEALINDVAEHTIANANHHHLKDTDANATSPEVDHYTPHLLNDSHIEVRSTKATNFLSFTFGLEMGHGNAVIINLGLIYTCDQMINFFAV